ncbi:MAG: hypothetical protein H0U74_14750 [Bradymonadaceae bacterium]|nr:hypothetical protein [Lujinxingiaceae bacterium]
MTSIDEVIARSRQAGGFSEHRRFTLAKSQAIQKMRQFALADPHFYILELIQSAVANGASFIDIKLENAQVVLSYTGGGYAEAELSQIFDFLFASRDNVAQGDLRLLALGVNALMLLEPREIVIESGDGTVKGTTRLVIRGREDVVEVGKSEQPLRGTFIRATDLKRSKITGRSALAPHELGPRECTAIEDRCITAPVPIIVNNRPLFGYSSERSPASLFGFSRTIRFDEGDLYGTIGIAARPTGAVFRLVTHGAWIQSTAHSFAPDLQIGGVVAFDRLRKTADHAGIVQDGVYEQMWLRLLPYVQQLRAGNQGLVNYQLAQLDGEHLAPAAAIALMRESGGAVLVAPSHASVGTRAEHSRRLGQALELPVFIVAADQQVSMRAIAGEGARIVIPDFDNPDELRFYAQPVCSPPPRPWLQEPSVLAPMPISQVIAWIGAEERVAKYLGSNPLQAFAQSVGAERTIAATLYSQAQPGHGEPTLRVEVRLCGRLLREAHIETVYPGHVLVLEMPEVRPALLIEPMTPGTLPAVDLVVSAVARHLTGELERSARRALGGMAHQEVAPGGGAASMIVSTIARAAIKRLRKGPGGQARVAFSVLDPDIDAAILQIPVLETLTGETLSIDAVASMMERQGGLLYGVVPEVAPDLEGLDQANILALGLHTERMLTALAGEASYVRVDSRDQLASYHGALCRDVAVGLKTYTSFPLLVEGADPTRWDAAEQRACAHALVTQLKGLVEARDNEVTQEFRRQALRHLQWFVVHREDYALAIEDFGLNDYPMFLTAQGRGASYRQIREVFAGAGRLRMLDGMASDVAAHFDADVAQAHTVQPWAGGIDLAMNPYVFWLLSKAGPISGLADFDFFERAPSDVNFPTPPEFIERIVVENAMFQAVLGVPLASDSDGAVLVVAADLNSVYTVEQIRRAYGVAGLVRLRAGEARSESVVSALAVAASELLERIATRIARGLLDRNDEAFEPAVLCLLGFAGQHLKFNTRPDGVIVAEVWNTVAQTIFDLPIFVGSGGNPISTQRLIREFQVAAYSQQACDWEQLEWATDVLDETIPAYCRSWILAHLHPQRIHRPAASQAAIELAQPQAVQLGPQTPQDVLAQSIGHWIERLRPDSGGVDFGQNLSVRIEENNYPPDHRAPGRPSALMIMHVNSGYYNDFVAVHPGDATLQTYHQVGINPAHWMTRWALDAGPSDPKPLAWLLLAVYAQLNDLLVAVTNAHELTFQQRIYEALAAGSLHWIEQPSPVPVHAEHQH